MAVRVFRLKCIEHDRAVDDELLGSLADHTDLYALYNTDKAFKAWLQERLGLVTVRNVEDSRVF